MVAAPATADAISRARRMPSLRVGLHVVLVDGRPLLPASVVTHLVDGNGVFRSNMAALGTVISFSRQARRQLAAEITAQFEAYRATGLPLDHVNAHKHFHLHPVIAAQIMAIGKKFGARAIRVPAEPVSIVRAIDPSVAALSPRLLGQWTRVLRAQVRRAGMITSDAVFGLAWSGAMTRGRVINLLDR